MAPPSSPTLFLFFTFFTLFAFISTNAREMSYFSKYSSNDPDTVNPSSTKPDTYNPSKEDENRMTNPFGSRFDQQFKQYEHTEDENYKPHTYSPWNQHSHHTSSVSSKTKPNYYNSNPFEEEDGVPSGKRGYGTIPKKHNHEDVKPSGMSDTRTMANGDFHYNVKDKSKHGSYYRSNSGLNSEGNRGGAHGQQYYSNRQDSMADPELITSYDP